MKFLIIILFLSSCASRFDDCRKQDQGSMFFLSYPVVQAYDCSERDLKGLNEYYDKLSKESVENTDKKLEVKK